MTRIERLADELFAEWRREGPSAIARARIERPWDMAMIVAWFTSLDKRERVAWCSKHDGMLH